MKLQTTISSSKQLGKKIFARHHQPLFVHEFKKKKKEKKIHTDQKPEPSGNSQPLTVTFALEIMGKNSPWFPLHFLGEKKKKKEQCKSIGWFYPVITYKASCSSVFLRPIQNHSLPATREVRGLCGRGPWTLCLCPPPEISHRRLL